nr:protein YIPF7-like [Onthophagus taurus]
MSGYTNDAFWAPNNRDITNFYDTNDEYENMQSQQLDFQTFNNQAGNTYYAPQNQFGTDFPDMLVPDYSKIPTVQNDGFDEPPLLEELEIYPDRIMEKTIAVLNPFRSHSLADDSDFLKEGADLAGPLVFCLALAVCLFVSGNKTPAGYIYGFSIISCLLMYCLLNLMTPSNDIFSLGVVASTLGYCLLPIVTLSFIGIFYTLHGSIGICMAIFCIIWSSLSASRLFVGMSGDSEQRPLIMYPSALVYAVFSLLVVF